MGVANVDIEHAVSKMAELALSQQKLESGQERDNRALFVRVDLRVGQPGSEEPFASRFVNFVFQRYGNGFHVWCKVVKHNVIWTIEEQDFETWENMSNHDSCWRSDGLKKVSETYFALCKEYDENTAPVMLDQFAWLDTWMMRIESEPSKKPYKWNITKLERIKD